MLLNLKKYHQVTLFLAVFHNVISLFQILRHINVSRDISSFLGHFPTSIQKKKKKKKNDTEKKFMYFLKKLHPKNLLYFFEWNLISSITTNLWSLLTNSYIFLKKKKKKNTSEFPNPKTKKILIFWDECSQSVEKKKLYSRVTADYV